MHSAAMRIALRVHAVEDVAEALPFFADQVLRRDSSSSKNTSFVSCPTMLRSVARSCRCPRRARSTRNTENPSDFFFASGSGVVRASSSMRSECWTREIQTFCPVTT